MLQRQREGEVNTLTPLFELTGIKTDHRGKKGSSYLQSMPFSLLNERSQGQSSGVTQQVVEEENRMIGPQALHAKKAIMR